MGIDLYSALMGASRYPSSLRGADLSKRNTAAPSSSFGEQAAAASSGRKVATYTPAYASMPSWGPNSLYDHHHASGQTIRVEYTEDSTEEDPIVRICGISLSGEYDYTMHINDIDARNATYPELCALVQHQAKTGEYQQMGRKYIDALPDEMDRGDYSKRQDFTQSLRGCISKNQRYNPNVAALAKNLLSFYEDFAAEHADKANTYTENQLDALLDTVGRARVDTRM